MSAHEPSDADWPVHDLRQSLDEGLARGAMLLTAGERHLVQRMLRLEGPAARVYARLLGRKPLAFPLDELTVPGVDDVPAAVASLRDGGWVDHLVPWPLRAQLLPRRRLVEGCRRLGLRRSGRVTELVQRLTPHTHWCDTPFVRPRHRGLVRRLQRWAALRAWPRPEERILERMGVTRWASYRCSSGPGLHPDRRSLRRWEALHGALGAEQLSVDEAIRALEDGTGDAPARLSLRGTLRRALQAHARQTERTEPADAVALYERITPLFPPGTLAFRHARALEACDRPADAFDVLAAARPHVHGDTLADVLRALKRVGRKQKRGVPPSPPLSPARRRTVSLPYVRTDHRPLWRGAPEAEPLPVEEALVDYLSARGRPAAHVEGRVFRTLFALLFAEAYFLPVPGQLPVPRLAGPLDLGSPGFFARRPVATAEVLAAVAAGDAARRVGQAVDRWGEVRLAGRHDLPAELLVAVADALPPQAFVQLLRTLAVERSAGLPDLVVPPGAAVTVDGHPRRVREGLLLVEVKGPGDTLSEAQKRWHHRLLGWGLAVELWDVRPAG